MDIKDKDELSCVIFARCHLGKNDGWYWMNLNQVLSFAGTMRKDQMAVDILHALREIVSGLNERPHGGLYQNYNEMRSAILEKVGAWDAMKETWKASANLPPLSGSPIPQIENVIDQSVTLLFHAESTDEALQAMSSLFEIVARVKKNYACLALARLLSETAQGCMTADEGLARLRDMIKRRDKIVAYHDDSLNKYLAAEHKFLKEAQDYADTHVTCCCNETDLHGDPVSLRCPVHRYR